VRTKAHTLRYFVHVAHILTALSLHVLGCRYVRGEWGDGFAPFEAHLGPILDAEAPGWRSKYGLDKAPHWAQARVAAFHHRVPCFHEAIAPFRSTSQAAVIMGETLLVHAGLELGNLRRHASALGLPPPQEEAAAPALAELEALNELASRWLAGAGGAGDSGGDAARPFDQPPAWITDNEGPLWSRLFSAPGAL
jgi:hypothetical protein